MQVFHGTNADAGTEMGQGGLNFWKPSATALAASSHWPLLLRSSYQNSYRHLSGTDPSLGVIATAGPVYMHGKCHLVFLREKPSSCPILASSPRPQTLLVHRQHGGHMEALILCQHWLQPLLLPQAPHRRGSVSPLLTAHCCLHRRLCWQPRPADAPHPRHPDVLPRTRKAREDMRCPWVVLCLDSSMGLREEFFQRMS